MTRQAGQVFKLGEKNWGWRYRDTATGKRPQRSGYETKGDARAALNLRLERISGDGSFKAHATVREIRDAYLETYEAADRTVAWLTYHAAKAVDAFGDQHPTTSHPRRSAAGAQACRTSRARTRRTACSGRSSRRPSRTGGSRRTWPRA
jgi:hypothetical protein